jgi:hypothetical protein
MRYGWVNQNQTFRQEIDRGHMWSPERNKTGHRNPFYEFMREVSSGDIVFSLCDTCIAALGVVSGYCRESKARGVRHRRHELVEFDLARRGDRRGNDSTCTPG